MPLLYGAEANEGRPIAELPVPAEIKKAGENYRVNPKILPRAELETR
jgi:hypothetical protein